jgi:hypothetical protein
MIRTLIIRQIEGKIIIEEEGEGEVGVEDLYKRRCLDKICQEEVEEEVEGEEEVIITKEEIIIK